MSQKQIAREVGLSRPTVQCHLRAAAKRGELGTKPVLPGFEIARTSAQLDDAGEVVREWVTQRPEHGPEFAAPDGHVVKGVSALVDASGREIIKWVKTREGRLDAQTVVEALRTAFEGVDSGYTPVAAPEAPEPDLLTLLPCNDWHVGMFAWGRETGANWDLRIAEQRIGVAVEQTIERSPVSGTFVVLGGGDLLHSDDSTNRTAKSGNPLDVDGRYPKVMQSAGRLMVRTIDAALARAQRVLVRILPGNHDEHTSHAVAAFLFAWYRDEPRVEVDLDPGLFWWHRHGKVMLGATHGHTVKIDQMPQIMAHRRAEDWGRTAFRYIHGFHLHHKRAIATEGGGCIAEVHQAPIPQDAWHYGAGFLSGRSIQSITYDSGFGEVSRTRVALLDA